MNVPFRLIRRPGDAPATAVLLPRAEASDALRLCARLALDPAGRVFAVQGGLLVRLDAPMRGAYPGGLRLRALAPNLYIPADSALVPALLDDEAAALTRNRGLVFRPGDDPLAFDPRSALEPSALLAIPPAPYREWLPPPDPPTLADRIEEFLVALPDEPPGGPAAEDPADVDDRTLDPGNEEIGSESPRPDATGPAKGAAGRAAMGFGQALMGIGNAFGMRGLAGLGARLVRGAIGMAPRLGEGILGQQSAALRELLREFREGNVERALRRALPVGDDPIAPRGAQIGAGTRLPNNDVSYRLASLLGGDSSRGSSASVWMGDHEILQALIREYRQAAEQAIARGDHRRAAFIYGKLLRDYQSAANALLRGGLYRDAAALFLARLDNKRAAASAYESAGEIDRAVGLYRELGQHEQAGDLLRKVGEEEAAQVEYLEAARQLAQRNPGSVGHLAAGRLLLDKAKRPDLAEKHFRNGWQARDQAASTAGGLALLGLLADAGRGGDVVALVGEADDRFAGPGEEAQAADFYHEVARVADIPILDGLRDDLRDRARLGLALKLGRATGAGHRPATAIISRLLGGERVWSPASVRDAEFAIAAAAGKGAPAAARNHRVVRIPGTGKVSAACAAHDSEEIFLGFEGGEVFRFAPANDEVELIVRDERPVVALAASGSGSPLIVIRDHDGGTHAALSSYQRGSSGAYSVVTAKSIETADAPWVTPIVSYGPFDFFGLWDGETLGLVETGGLFRLIQRLEVDGWSPPSVALLVPPRVDSGQWKVAYDTSGAEHRPIHVRSGAETHPTILSLHGRSWLVVAPPYDAPRQTGVPQPPNQVFARPPLRHPVASWWWSTDHAVEAATIGAFGTLYWSAFGYDHAGLVISGQGSSGTKGGYTAAAILAPGLVAAIGAGKVDWYARSSSDTLAPRGTASSSLTDVAALFPSRRTGELIALGPDGSILRLPDRPTSRPSAQR